MKHYDYTIGMFNKTDIYVAHDKCHYTTSNFVAVCNGNKIEFDGACWYLWQDSTLITSGFISGLAIRKVRRDVNICGAPVDFIEYRYTAYDSIDL